MNSGSPIPIIAAGTNAPVPALGIGALTAFAISGCLISICETGPLVTVQKSMDAANITTGSSRFLSVIRSDTRLADTCRRQQYHRIHQHLEHAGVIGRHGNGSCLPAGKLWNWVSSLAGKSGCVTIHALIAANATTHPPSHSKPAFSPGRILAKL